MIYDVLEKLGRWEVALVDAPVEVVDALDYFGHLVVLEGNIDDIDTRGDELLGAALYAGPMRRRLLKSPDELHLAGAGMALWLGDEDGKASTVFVNGETFAAETFAQTIRDLLPPGTVTEGTLYSVAGSYTGTHQYQSPREAIDYVAGVFDAHWRVNADFTLDAGAASDLFVTTPEAIIVRRPSGAGGTIGLNDAAGTVTTDQDVRDYTTDVLLLGAVDGADVVSGVAQTASGSIPYKNPQGNTLNLTRVVREAETAGGNATARAQLALNRFANPRKAITLTADDYELIGVVAPGDTVYVYDPDAGLIDTANEVDHNGELIHPLALQVIALEYPLRQGLTVAYRTGAGAWLDLTPYVEWEEAGAGANITVGAYPRTIGGAASIYGGVKDATATTTGDAAIPAAPTLTTPFTTGTYIDATGATVAYIVADWAEPLNTDASTIVDGSYYEVHIQRAGASDWSPHFAGWDTTELELQGLANGEDYDVRVRAVDLAGNVGAWSTTETTTAAPDTVPPSTPSTPTVAGNPLAIQVIHNLDKAAGGDLELDVDYLEVHSAAASGFTPSASTMLGRLQVGAGAIALGIDVLETFAEPVSDGTARWVKVIAVDRSGNASTASAAATVTADLIATANIDDLAVTNAKIADLEVNKLVAGSGIVADLTIAASGSMQSANYTPGATGAGWQYDDTTAILNDATIRGTLDGTDGTFTGTLSAGVVEGGELHIPDEDTTANSFHIDTDGSAWVGATATNKATAPLQINKAGWIRAGSATTYVELLGATGRIELNAGATTIDPAYIRAAIATQQRLELTSGTHTGYTVAATLALWSGASAGDERVVVENLRAGGTIYIDDELQVANGTAAAPTITFENDTDLGLYRAAGNALGFAASGTGIARIVPGGFQPIADNSVDIGSGSLRWDDIYATNDVIQTSDLRDKRLASGRHRLGLDFLLALDPIAYRWKGRQGRIHQGLAAQHVTAALEAAGHNPAKHGLWISERDDAGELVPEGRQGLRYGELTAPIIAGIQELADRLTRLEKDTANG